MDNNSNQENKISPVSTSQNIRFIKALWIIIIAFLFFGTFLFGFIIGKKSVTGSTKIALDSYQTITSDKPTEILATPSKAETREIVKEFPSLDRQFIFYLIPFSDDKCLYGVRDSMGAKLDLSKLIGSDKISCQIGAGVFSSFLYWIDNNKFILTDTPGEIKIIDVVNLEIETYKYDQNKYFFAGANRSLKYWLFREVNQKETTSYILMDENKKIVLGNITISSNNDRGVLYDEVNDGFLFISRTYTGEDVSVKLDYLPLNTLTLRNVLSTEPITAPGRGCDSETLLSLPNEIILTQGCLTVDAKYLSSDGNIHIKL